VIDYFPSSIINPVGKKISLMKWLLRRRSLWIKNAGREITMII
jgi:hypothetical protein